MANYSQSMRDALELMYARNQEKIDKLDEGTIDKVKNIASKKSAAKIDGVTVDMFTASAISQIYDKVNDANKKKMEKASIRMLVNLAHKVMGMKEENLQEVTDKEINAVKKLSKDIEKIKKDYFKITKMGDKTLQSQAFNRQYESILKLSLIHI